MQKFTQIQSTQSIQSSLPLLMGNARTAISCSSGSAFPTSNLEIGMLCYRTDLLKLYILRDSTPTWGLIADLSASNSASVAETLRNVLIRGASGNDGGALLLAKPESGNTLASHVQIAVKGDRLLIRDNGSGKGFYLDMAKGAASAAQQIWHSGNMGANSGLDADKLRGATTGNAEGNIPLSNRTMNTGLNAELLGGVTRDFFAPITSPNFKVAAYAPTAAVGTNTTHIATCAFVQSALGTVDLSSRLALSGGQMYGNLHISSGLLWLFGYNGNSNASVILMNAAQSRYLMFDGTNYVMPNSNLYVNGGLVWTSANVGTPIVAPYGVYTGDQGVIYESGPSGTYVVPLRTGIETFRSGNALAARAVIVNCKNCLAQNCNCASCFLEGTMVLMADGTEKEISTIKAGDRVQGPTGPWTVDYLYKPMLGSHREIYRFRDGSLAWSAEHPLWAKAPSGDQWWWSVDPDCWRAEVAGGHIVGLFDNGSLLEGPGHQFAHVGKLWADCQPEVVKGFPPNTELYLPIAADGDRILIVNGYLVAAGMDQWRYDYSQFEWDETKAAKIRESIRAAREKA
ncbi:hypothetical protein [Achromobacter sp. AGC39]